MWSVTSIFILHTAEINLKPNFIYVSCVIYTWNLQLFGLI